MTRVKENKPKARSHDEGLWIVTADNIWLKVKPDKVEAKKLIEEPEIVYGKPQKEGEPVQLIQSATYPVFRDDVVQLLMQKLNDGGHTPDKLIPLAEGDKLGAAKRLEVVLTAAFKMSQEIPLIKYNRSYVDEQLKRVDTYEKYVIKEGKMEKLPYFEKSHEIAEKDDAGKVHVMPAIYWDLWLPESTYELSPYDDEDTPGLAALVKKLEEYPIPEGKKVVKQEAMLYKEGYIGQSGASSGYYAFIRGKRVMGKDDVERFVLEMKLSKTMYQPMHLTEFPAEGAQAVPVGRPTLKMASVDDLLATLTK